LLTLRSRIPDQAIIDAYITCADCGKRWVDAAAVLARIVEKADSAETFLDLAEANAHPKHLYSEQGGAGRWSLCHTTDCIINMSEFEFPAGTRIEYLVFEERDAREAQDFRLALNGLATYRAS